MFDCGRFAVAFRLSRIAVPAVLLLLSGCGDIGQIGGGQAPPAMTAISCSTTTLTGPASDVCTVTVSAGPATVNLTSSNPAVSVPGSAQVPPGTGAATFTAIAAAVTTPQTATITATLAGTSASTQLNLNAASAALTVSTSTLSFGSIPLNTAATQAFSVTSTGTIPLTISAAAISGSGFSLAGENLPMTLLPAQTVTFPVAFDPATAGPASGTLTLSSNAANTADVMIALSGAGQAPPVPSAIACSSSSLTGPSADTCTLALTSPAGNGGLTVNLSASDTAVLVPASVTIPSGSATAAFSVTAAAVTTDRTATITAAANGAAASVILRLNAATPALTLSAPAIAFGAVQLDTPATQPLTLTSTGNVPLIINRVSISGSGFSVSGSAFPMTLNPNQTTTLVIALNLTTPGAAAGALTITSNAAGSPTATVALSGTAQPVPALSALSCASGSLTGAATDVCTVSLTSAAGASGVPVILSSSNSALAVPASVIVPAGAAAASFTAAASAVTSPLGVILTAAAGGVSRTASIQLNAALPGLTLSAASLAFGTVQINSPASQTLSITSSGNVPLVMSSASVSGSGFSLSGASFPLSLSPNQTAPLTITFDPAAAGAASGMLIIATNAANGAGSATVTLSGTGQALPVPAAVSCTRNSLTGAAADSCTVALTSAATPNGVTVSLSSSNSALAVPGSVMVTSGATTASFSATASSVATAQSATITATANGASAATSLQLNAATSSLTISPSSLNFGGVQLNSATMLPVTLTSAGTVPLTISAASITGAGFALSGASFPLTLNPNQAVTLTVAFDPATAGAVSGALTVSSNATGGSPSTVSLSGTGQAPPTLSGLSCTSASLTGAASDICTVTLSSAAASGGVSVGLSSSNSSVSVPASITIPSGASTGSFTAAASAVTSTQTVIITAAAGTAAKTTSLLLNAAAPGLTLSGPTISFGAVQLNTTISQSLTITSAGNVPLTISTAAVAGNGFQISAAPFPVTLNPGQKLTLTVSFDPTAAGTAVGSLTIVSNAVAGNAIVSLTGTAQAPPTPASISCTSASLTGAATDACTMTLTSPAAAGGLIVALASNNSAVSVPATVTLPGGSAAVGFTATASAVATDQTATLTATANGAKAATELQLNAARAALTSSAVNVAFGSVQLNTDSQQSVTLTSSGNVPVTITAVTVTGTGFSVSVGTLPLILNPSQSATVEVTFDPATAGVHSGSVTVSSSASAGGTTSIALSGTGQVPAALSALSCSSASLTGAIADSCTVTLTAAAPSGGLTVNLASNNSALTVPASVAVASGSATAGFSASASAVTTAQTAVITASAGGVTRTASLQLNAWVATLSIGASTVAFGNVDLHAPATQSVILTSSGTAPVTMTAGTLTGTGFSMSGISFPRTLQPGQQATLNITFDPASAGASSGALALASNCSMGAMTLSLSGTGVQASHSVDLSWDPPTASADPVAGYNIYRSAGSGAFRLLNASVDTLTTYTDNTVQNGLSYTYQVTSVDAQGIESTPSNTYTAAIP